MKFTSLVIVFFLLGNLVSKGETKDNNSDSLNKQMNTEEHDFFFDKLKCLIAKILNIKVNNINALSVMQTIKVEEALVFVAKYFDKNRKFALRLFEQKVSALKEKVLPVEGFNIESFIILKAFAIFVNSDAGSKDAECKSLYCSHYDFLKDLRIIKIINSFNPHFNIQDIRLPQQLLLSFLATKDIQYLVKMFNLWFDQEPPSDEELTKDLHEIIDSSDSLLEAKEEFKKNVFYMIVRDIIKNEVAEVESQILLILKNDLVEGKVKDNLIKEFTHINWRREWIMKL